MFACKRIAKLIKKTITTVFNNTIYIPVVINDNLKYIFF